MRCANKIRNKLNADITHHIDGCIGIFVKEVIIVEKSCISITDIRC